MEIFVAKSGGFCFGVRRAVEGVYKQAEKGKTVTLGPVIHNKKVVAKMRDEGVWIVDRLDDITDETVIIRSHGIPPSVYNELRERNINYADYTCPYVKKIHNIAQDTINSDKKLIVLGDFSHPEILGISGWANNAAIILKSAEEARTYVFDENISYCLVAQTTFSVELFNEITDILILRLKSLEVINTICSATSANQKEAGELSKKVDKMIIIGDRESSNTKKLFDICSKNQKNTYLVESIDEIMLNVFSYNDKIGITAGASTPPAIIKEAFSFMSEMGTNNQSFEEMLGESVVSLHTGDVVKGKVIQVINGEVFVNLGYKSDGLIERGQFAEDPGIDPAEILKPGDEIEVFVIRVNDLDGNVLLSKKRIDSQKFVKEIENAFENGGVLPGKFTEVVKGGVIAMIGGVRAFVPSSQVSNRFVEDLNTLKGKEFNFNIIEYDKAKKRIVAGRKELASREAEVAKEAVFSKIEPGMKIDTKVTRITDFGAFCDLGGVDGLIHISELSWARVKKVTDVLKEGASVKVTVLEVNKEKGKISLSLKDINSNPWSNIEEKYPVGSVVSGKVVRFAPFGAFVELEEGLDGLVHVSQISAKHVVKPENELTLGEIIEVKVTEVDLERKKISLSKKAVDGIMPDEAGPDAKETVAPETVAAETVAPEIVAVETVAPETVAPETVAPEIVALETVALETVALETVAPETVALETVAAETVAVEEKKEIKETKKEKESKE